MEETLPLVCVNVLLDANPEPDVVDTSKPVGAVTVIFAVKLDPDTVKDCSALAVFTHELNAFNVPEVVIEGGTVYVIFTSPRAPAPPVPVLIVLLV